MNGGHDLGGVDGLGPINPEPEALESVFHHEWEKRAFALTLACGFWGQWNLDESRHARERQHPADYLKNTYYENWLQGLETLLAEKRLLEDENIQKLSSKCISADSVGDILSRGGPVNMPTDTTPAFHPGDDVKVINNHITGHTRVPRYCAGRIGFIEAVQGFHVFPDANALGQRTGQYLYSVRISAQELWGRDSHSVYVDLWQPHLTSVRKS